MSWLEGVQPVKVMVRVPVMLEEVVVVVEVEV